MVGIRGDFGGLTEGAESGVWMEENMGAGHSVTGKDRARAVQGRSIVGHGVTDPRVEVPSDSLRVEVPSDSLRVSGQPPREAQRTTNGCVPSRIALYLPIHRFLAERIMKCLSST